MLHVEKMEVDDFPFAVQLSNTMNWNMTLKDFEFMLKLEPEGCFMALQGRERLGIATSVSFGKTGWLGNLIVKENARRKGAGNLLIRHIIDYLQKKGVETIGLYAYPHLVKLYEHFGFKSDSDFFVLKGKPALPATQVKLQAARRQDVPKIIDFDCQCFGANRAIYVISQLKTMKL